MKKLDMDENIDIRPAVKRDWTAVGQLINGIQRREFGIPITLEDQPDLSDIDGYYRQGVGDFWVAEVSRQIIGTIALIDIGQNEGALRKMFVHKDFRGVEKGVAIKLLDILLAHARKNSLARIFLGTTAQFLAAHRFYEKNGFEYIEADNLPERFPRMDVDVRFYKIEL